MAGNYSADIQAILAGSKHIAAAVSYGERMVPNFESDSEGYSGWWGEEGGDDLFANQVGEQVRDEQERVITTANAITEGFLALVDAVAGEAQNVRRPQELALDDITTHGTESESRR
ncbi:hypothetical protein [Streptomyces sp. NPDC088261]|uniref:hypothetical protein n=1 Tax=Streptomyces sp. NPDC088261 TaxID=3365851 RepID=UPI00382782D6